MNAASQAALLLRALRFWTRIPIPVQAFEVDPFAPPDMTSLAALSPIAGAIIGLVGALVLWLAMALGLGALPAAVLGVAALVVVTGAMHEDALADIADGFGGGGTIERKLEIMKDPRLGSYGVVAIVLALLFKIGAIAALVEEAGVAAGAFAIMGAAALSRAAGLWPLVALDPVRQDGSGAAAGRLAFDVWRVAFAIGATIAMICAVGIAGLDGLLAPILAAALAYGVTKLAARQIGGQTGDVCGAATQCAELGFLAGLLTAVSG